MRRASGLLFAWLAACGPPAPDSVVIGVHIDEDVPFDLGTADVELRDGDVVVDHTVTRLTASVVDPRGIALAHFDGLLHDYTVHVVVRTADAVLLDQTCTRRYASPRRAVLIVSACDTGACTSCDPFEHMPDAGAPDGG